MFRPLLPALTQTRQIIAVEQQNHGRTADIDRPLRYEQLADDAAAFLRYLAIDRAGVFGFSMGSAAGWQLAIRHPQLIRKLVGAISYKMVYGSIPGGWCRHDSIGAHGQSWGRILLPTQK
jgi:dienelactone hydrolase